jgi:hypothetical protein
MNLVVALGFFLEWKEHKKNNEWIYTIYYQLNNLPMHILLFVVLVSLASLSGCYIGQKLFGRLYNKCEIHSQKQIKQNVW